MFNPILLKDVTAAELAKSLASTFKVVILMGDLLIFVMSLLKVSSETQFRLLAQEGRIKKSCDFEPVLHDTLRKLGEEELKSVCKGEGYKEL